MRGKKSLEEMSAETGLAVRTLWDWEHGRGLQTIDKLDTLAGALGKTLSGLLRG